MNYEQVVQLIIQCVVGAAALLGVVWAMLAIIARGDKAIGDLVVAVQKELAGEIRAVDEKRSENVRLLHAKIDDLVRRLDDKVDETAESLDSKFGVVRAMLDTVRAEYVRREDLDNHLSRIENTLRDMMGRQERMASRLDDGLSQMVNTLARAIESLNQRDLRAAPGHGS